MKEALTQKQNQAIYAAINRWAKEVEFSDFLYPLLNFSETEMSALKIIINKINEWNFLKRSYGAPGYFKENQQQQVRDLETWLGDNCNRHLIDMKIEVQKFLEANKIDPNPIYIEV